MNMKKMAITSAAFALTMAATAAEMEIAWKYDDGKVETEHREIGEWQAGKDVVEFRLAKTEILAKKAKSVTMTPSFAKAKKGDKGFWVFSSGEYGTYRLDEGEKKCNRWQLMSVYGMQTPECTYAAIVTGLKYYFTTVISAKGGEYRMSAMLENELCIKPYEDFVIEFHRLTGKDATLGGIARTYRNSQLKNKLVEPMAERAKKNPILKQAIDGVEVRVRQAWKPVPSPILDQTPENEPPVKPVVTFDRVQDIAREFKAQGIGDAEFCLVGWNIGGHDGRWPQVFPVEPSLGGEGKLRACIAAVKELGYLIVPHGNYLDSYRIADSWDMEWLLKDLDGETTMHAGKWGGGYGYRICPQRAYEKFMSREMPRMKGLGFKGLGYFDVVTVVKARYCGDPRHPLSGADAARWWGKGAALSRECFGGFSSEGSFDHFAKYLDFGLYASFADPKKENQGMVDRMEMLPELVYNGIYAMNPFTCTVNFTAQDRYCQLKLIEFGGRPAFYFYSKFVSNGKDWMGKSDLGCATDEELKASVAKIKKGYDVYARLSHLQYVFMREHRSPQAGVWLTEYENGETVGVNYNSEPVVVEGHEIAAEDWSIWGAGH